MRNQKDNARGVESGQKSNILCIWVAFFFAHHFVAKDDEDCQDDVEDCDDEWCNVGHLAKSALFNQWLMIGREWR